MLLMGSVLHEHTPPLKVELCWSSDNMFVGDVSRAVNVTVNTGFLFCSEGWQALRDSVWTLQWSGVGSKVSPAKLFMEPLRKDNPPSLSRYPQHVLLTLDKGMRGTWGLKLQGYR